MAGMVTKKPKAGKKLTKPLSGARGIASSNPYGDMFGILKKDKPKFKKAPKR